MSSPGSDVLTIELPARLASDRAAACLFVVSALTIEAVVARYPDGPAGIGLAAGILLAVWHLWLGRKSARVRTAALDSRGDWQLGLADGRRVAAVLLPGSRVLGRTVLLRLRGGRLTRSAWLTAWDLPAPDLQRLTVRLMAVGPTSGAGHRRGAAADR
jgi:hypothetical protein